MLLIRKSNARENYYKYLGRFLDWKRWSNQYFMIMKLCLAPMDWITNCATRQITLEVFEKYKKETDSLQVWTEFMNVDGFLRNPDAVIQHLQVTDFQKPIAQIYGGNENTLLEASLKIEKEYWHLFAGIELNTGCPSNTVMKCGWWSDMMKNRQKTLEIIKKISKSLKNLPFSIKTRTGLNDKDKAQQMDFLVEASKYCSMISVHWRTLKQLYTGNADWEWIAGFQKIMTDDFKKLDGKWCEVIWNGGILAYDQAQKYQELYKLDWIMIWQWAIWNPRIFTPHCPTQEEKMNILLRHLEMSIACDQIFLSNPKNILIKMDDLEQKIAENETWPDFSSHSLVEFRKFLFAYVKGVSDSREWKTQMLNVKTYKEMKEKIITFFWA